jgi:hypothetical protein
MVRLAVPEKIGAGLFPARDATLSKAIEDRFKPQA